MVKRSNYSIVLKASKNDLEAFILKNNPSVKEILNKSVILNLVDATIRKLTNGINIEIKKENDKYVLMYPERAPWQFNKQDFELTETGIINYLLVIGEKIDGEEKKKEDVTFAKGTSIRCYYSHALYSPLHHFDKAPQEHQECKAAQLVRMVKAPAYDFIADEDVLDEIGLHPACSVSPFLFNYIRRSNAGLMQNFDIMYRRDALEESHLCIVYKFPWEFPFKAAIPRTEYFEVGETIGGLFPSVHSIDRQLFRLAQAEDDFDLTPF